MRQGHSSIERQTMTVCVVLAPFLGSLAQCLHLLSRPFLCLQDTRMYPTSGMDVTGKPGRIDNVRCPGEALAHPWPTEIAEYRLNSYVLQIVIKVNV